SGPWAAVSAARAALSGRARGASKGRDGAVEAIRALMVAKRSAAGERTQTINQARALILTGPEDLRARFTGHTVAALVAELASLRPRPGSTVGHRRSPGGDRQANHALWRIVFTRMGSDPATRAYVDRRTQEGLSKKEIIRCLKRYVAREVYPHLRSSGG